MRKYLLLLLLATVMTVQTAEAALQARSATPDAATGGHPTWYQDTAGLAAAPCLDNLGFCGLVPGPGFNGTLPATFPTNIPEEWFYWSATAIFDVNGASALVVLALEAIYVDQFGVLVPPNTAGAQPSTFQRLRVILDNAPVAGTYTVEHPWGATTFSCAAPGLCKFTRDIGGAAANDFDTALGVGVFTPPDNSMSTFLVQASAAPPAGYFGDGATIGVVTGGTVRNRVDILSPTAVNIGGTDLFAITGKKFGMEVSPLTANAGAIVIPNSAAPQTITITNPNTVNGLTIPAAGGVAFAAGPHNADFTVTAETCTAAPLLAAIAPPDPTQTTNKCTITVQYTPKPETPETANRSATLLITPSLPAGTPAGKVVLSGTAQYPVTATAGTNGAITGAAVTALAANAGTSPVYTITPNAKWEVKDITVNGTLSTFTKASNPTQAVTFTAPALTGPQDIVATFMPSGNLTGSGTLGAGDALKALRILLGLQTPAGDDLTAMKVHPLDAQGRPSGIAGTPDLNDVVLILKRALGIISW